MRARVLTKWALYYVFGLVWLVAMVFVMIGRVQTSPLGYTTELTIGIVVVGGCLLAALVGFPLWVLPNIRSKAALQRRYPEAVIMTARRDDFRAFIDVDALGIFYRKLPYFLTVVADNAGTSAWMAGEPGEQPRQVTVIPWESIEEIEQSTSDGPLPQYVLVTTVHWHGESLPLQMTLGSTSVGGLFPQTYRESRRSLEALTKLSERARSR